MLRYAIVAGGPEHLLPDLSAPRFKNLRWVGADRGTLILLNRGITPEHAFGDFDSLSADEWKRVDSGDFAKTTFPAEKDRTDMEIALDWVLRKKPDECLILGGTGGRVDHMLVNIHLLLKGLGTGTKLSMVDRKNMITILKPGTYPVMRNPEYVYLSFAALTERVRGLTLRGVRYPLSGADLAVGSSLCVSNEVVKDVCTVSFSEGLLIMMRCSD